MDSPFAILAKENDIMWRCVTFEYRYTTFVVDIATVYYIALQIL
jgi:hypothetical protein